MKLFPIEIESIEMINAVVYRLIYTRLDDAFQSLGKFDKIIYKLTDDLSRVIKSYGKIECYKDCASSPPTTDLEWKKVANNFNSNDLHITLDRQNFLYELLSFFSETIPDFNDLTDNRRVVINFGLNVIIDVSKNNELSFFKTDLAGSPMWFYIDLSSDSLDELGWSKYGDHYIIKNDPRNTPSYDEETNTFLN